MAKEAIHVDITNKRELLQIVEQAQSAHQPLILSKGSEDVAILRTVKRSTRRRASGNVLTREDPLFSLIGIGESNVPGGVSGRKHEYLLEAYRQRNR